MQLWLELLICLVVIAYAGYYLSRYGDIIAEKNRYVCKLGWIDSASHRDLLARTSHGDYFSDYRGCTKYCCW